MDAISQLSATLAGRYEVTREIGAGGMATVFLARDVRHERNVALKLLKPELGAVLGVERFLSEIRVTANLQHPNLLALFDSGMANGLPFYVMPFVEGESLRGRLDRERQLPVDEAIRITLAVAAALEYAHGHGVIHRDLKPENILLQAGQPVVSDFGIALAVSNAGGTRVTQTGLSLGTPQYMSPEQATGDRVIDARSDIYSLAAVLYEMLTGEPPHTGTTAQAVISRVITERARDVRSSRPNVPEAVAEAVERGLEKLPADRWATAGEFSDALRGKISAGYTTGGRHSAHVRTWRTESRNPVAITACVVAIASLAFAGSQWHATPPPATGQTERFLIAPTKDASAPPTAGVSLAISPDGRTVAFVGRLAGTNRNRLLLRRLGTLGIDTVPNGYGAAAPAFSPDGQWVAFIANAVLFRYSLSGGAPLKISEIGGAPNGIAWITPDEIVVTLRRDLLIQPTAGGERVRLDGAIEGEVSRQYPKPLGDGDHVLYASWRDGGLTKSEIAVTSIRTKQSRLLGVTGVCPLGVVDDMLVYVTADQAVMSVPFDRRALRVTGQAVPIESGVLLGSRGACKAGIAEDGTLALQRGWPRSQLVLVDNRGVERATLGDLNSYAFPRFSPDGKQIAATIVSGARSDIWIYRIADGTMTRLTDGNSVNERPEWSHDGKRVLFRSDRSGERSGIWWQLADRSGPATALLLNDRADYFEAVATPDGRGIVYQVDTAAADLMYRNLVGDTVPRPVAAEPLVSEDRGRVSADGRWVAFTSTATGAPQVVVQRLDSAGGQVQVSTTGGSEPVWSRSGRRLFYRDGSRFLAVTWEANPEFRIVSRSSLFEDQYLVGSQPHAGYDVSLDGLFLVPKTTESSEIVVVRHWLREMRRR